MKSPLVDALRKANESTATGDDTDTILVDGLPHDRTLTANEDYSVETLEDDAEFELLDSGDEDLLLEEDAGGQVGENDEPPNVGLSASKALTATQALRQTSLAVEAPPMPLSGQQTLTALVKLGRYSPLICAALGAAAAGVYLAWLSFGGAYENTELRALPSQVNTVNSEIAKFEAGASPFKLIVDAPSAAVDEGGVPE